MNRYGIRRAALGACAALALAVLPARGTAQLTMSGTCAPGPVCNALRFTLLWGGAGPIDFYTLSLTLATGGLWVFTGAAGDPVSAQDSFGTFPGSFLSGAGSHTLTIQFADPNDPSAVGFSLTDFAPFFAPTGWVDLAAAGSGGGTFTFSATDVNANQYGGTGTITVGVVPEPVSLSLVGTGLLGIAAARRRRKPRRPENLL